jgi:hypothetical protein
MNDLQVLMCYVLCFGLLLFGLTVLFQVLRFIHILNCFKADLFLLTTIQKEMIMTINRRFNKDNVEVTEITEDVSSALLKLLKSLTGLDFEHAGLSKEEERKITQLQVALENPPV